MMPHLSSSSLLCALPASLSISEQMVCTSCSSVCRGSSPSFAIDDRAYGALNAIFLTGGPPPRDLPEKKPAKGPLPLSAAGVVRCVFRFSPIFESVRVLVLVKSSLPG